MQPKHLVCHLVTSVLNKFMNVECRWMNEIKSYTELTPLADFMHCTAIIFFSYWIMFNETNIVSIQAAEV